MYTEYYNIFQIFKFLKDIVIQILVTLWNNTLSDALFINVCTLVPSNELHIYIFWH